MADLTIDPKAQESYNQWRAKKLDQMPDLSIEAYNQEQMMLSAAWKLGLKAGLAGKGEDACPYDNDGIGL